MAFVKNYSNNLSLYTSQRIAGIVKPRLSDVTLTDKVGKVTQNCGGNVNHQEESGSGNYNSEPQFS
jgi:hypothetical protein